MQQHREKLSNENKRTLSPLVQQQEPVVAWVEAVLLLLLLGWALLLLLVQQQDHMANMQQQHPSSCLQQVVSMHLACSSLPPHPQLPLLHLNWVALYQAAR